MRPVHRGRGGRRAFAVAVLAGALLAPSALAASNTTLQTRDVNGGPVDSGAFASGVSGDGRHLALATSSTDLGWPDTNPGAGDVYVLDRQTGLYTKLSKGPNGESGNSSAGGVIDISRDGNFVAFDLKASNIMPGDPNFITDDVVVWSRAVEEDGNPSTFSLSYVSVTPQGGPAAAGAMDPSISGDGRYVTFTSRASNLVSGDTNNRSDVFRRDRLTNTMIRVSVADNESQANAGYGDDGSGQGAISDDGNVVVFWSFATNLDGADPNPQNPDIYIRDIAAGTTERISVTHHGGPHDPNGFAWNQAPEISGDGNVVSWMSWDEELVPNDGNDVADVFAYDRTTGETEMVSVRGVSCGFPKTSWFSTLDHTGDRIAFDSDSAILVPGDSNNQRDVFVRDRSEGKTRIASVTVGDGPANNMSVGGFFADTGELFYTSGASNLTADDGNGGIFDVFTSNPIDGQPVAPPKIDLFGSDVDPEGDPPTVTDAAYTLQLSRPLCDGEEASVTFSTANDSATAGVDYEATTQTVTFGPGERTKSVNVPVNGDLADEDDELFTATLTQPSGVTLGSADASTFIIDDDEPPTISVDDDEVTEGNPGDTRELVFEITLDRPSGFPVTVAYATGPGSAGDPGDYAGASGTLTFEPGETSKEVRLGVVSDGVDEDDESMTITLAGPENASIEDGEGTGTIRDDDSAELSIDDVTVTEGPTGTTTPATFTIGLSAPSSRTVSVFYATAPGSAAEAVDYTGGAGSVSFAPGETSKEVVVPVLGDALDESDETYNVLLSEPSHAAIADGEGLGTILDDDEPPAGDLSCQATAARLLGNTYAQSNPPDVPCADDSKRVQRIDLPLGGLNRVTLDALESKTVDAPGTGDAAASVAAAFVRIGTVTISAQALTTEASVRCEGGRAVFASRSTGVVTVNGRRITDGTTSLNLGVVAVHLNRELRTGTDVTRRALEISAPLLGINIVLAESRADVHGDPCRR